MVLFQFMKWILDWTGHTGLDYWTVTQQRNAISPR